MKLFPHPSKRDTFRIIPVCFQEDAVLTLVLRDKYLFGATLFIYPALFFFLDQWEQSTSSFPCWEMMAGHDSKLSNQKKFWVLVLVSTQGHTFFFFSLYDCFSLVFTLWLIFNRPAVKQHSNILICNLSPRKSHGIHLMWSVAWGWSPNITERKLVHLLNVGYFTQHQPLQSLWFIAVVQYNSLSWQIKFTYCPTLPNFYIHFKDYWLNWWKVPLP